MPYVETPDGTRLFYKDWGIAFGPQAASGPQAGRPVLFLHGWPLNADMWEYQMAPLVAAGFRCVAVDRRGFGRSDQPGCGYGYDTFADDLAVLVTALDLREATLVGFSMGGAEIVRYLARHGGARVRRVAFVGAALAAMDEGMAAMMCQAIAADRPGFMTDGVPTLFASSGGEPVSAAQMQWVVGLALQASPLATLACLRGFGQSDLRGELAAVTMPALVVHGDADTSQPIAAAREVAASLPDARMIEYAGAPHGLFLTERTRLAADLRRFVEEP
jgi:pimeloyl-ACP methyl ester carboxylesterase